MQLPKFHATEKGNFR